SALAQYSLGGMYEYGRGVEKDEKEAVKWFRKAAEQGYEPAKLALKQIEK
ncbi:MAG: SEL1-like repeat protein, partial [Planctomycetota bacterium]|nr:SEL1-like repeat protein [Planctomycetota bacterium]